MRRKLRCWLLGHKPTGFRKAGPSPWLREPDGIRIVSHCARCRADTSRTLPPRLLIVSDGRLITDPDEAEALGLTTEARRLREANERGRP